MATPRRRFVTIETRLVREPWPLEVRFAALALAALMIDRWAADGTSFEEASRATLTPGDLLNVTAQSTSDRAREVLEQLAAVTSIRIDFRGEFTHVRWAKWAKIQGAGRPALGARSGRARASGCPSASASASASEQATPSPAPGGAGRKVGKGEAEPLELAAQRWARMFQAQAGASEDPVAWVRETLPLLGWPDTPNEELREALWRFWNQRWRDDRRAAEQRQRSAVEGARKRGSGAPTALGDLVAPSKAGSADATGGAR